MLTMGVLILTALLCLLSRVVNGADGPCPFNTADCTCYDWTSGVSFDKAVCKSRNALVPSFSGSDGTYTVFEELSLTFNAYRIEPRSFVSFKLINFLNLTQPEGPSAVKCEWASQAFYGPQIQGLAVSNVAGIIPPPYALLEIAGDLTALHVINCRETISLRANVFNKFQQLNVLLIKNTTINNIDDQAFVGLNNLKELWLLNTNLTQFPTKAVQDLKKLYRIDLTDSKIQKFTADDFKSFDDLVFLILDGNDINAAVSSGALENIPKTVSTLFLARSSTPLKNVPSNVLAKASEVTILSLEQNAIETIKNGDFPDGNQIVTLALSNNPITNIESGAMQYLTKVGILALSGTYLRAFDLSLLNGMVYLYMLDLSDNKGLTQFAITNSNMVPPNLSSIDLRGSAIATIDAKLEEVVAKPRFQVLDISNSTTITCDPSVAWMARYVLCPPVRVYVKDARCSTGTYLSSYLAQLVPNPCDVPSTTPSVPATSTTPVATSTAPQTSSVPPSGSTTAPPPATTTAPAGTTTVTVPDVTSTTAPASSTAPSTTIAVSTPTTKGASTITTNIGLSMAMAATLSIVFKSI